MKISRLLVAIFATAGLGISYAQPMNKDVRDTTYKSAAAQYKVDNAACSSLSGNAKDICVEDAKGKEKIAKADADATYQNSPKSREAARVARADATYAVAKEKCDDLAGNAKDVCVKEAKAVHVKGKADAKVDRVAGDTRNSSATKNADARKDAAEEKRDAEYKVAAEKCDALTSTAKDTCVRDAKMRYRKS